MPEQPAVQLKGYLTICTLNMQSTRDAAADPRDY